jgi:hypothetical protein
MYNYRIEYYEQDGYTTTLNHFECFAEDVEHAKEQLFDAEGGVAVYSVQKLPLLINKEAAEYIINWLQKINHKRHLTINEMDYTDILAAVDSYNTHN